MSSKKQKQMAVRELSEVGAVVYVQFNLGQTAMMHGYCSLVLLNIDIH